MYLCSTYRLTYLTTLASCLASSGVASDGSGGHTPPGENQRKILYKKHVFEGL